MVGAFEGAIVAAGHGERLKAATGGLPKPLADVGGQPLLLRQAQALRGAGAARVVAVVNSHTARLLGAEALELPGWLVLCVRDTPNSMESLLALGEYLRPGWFFLATVDAVGDFAEFARFARRAEELSGEDTDRFQGVLGVVRWRGERGPLFVEVGGDGAIARLGGGRTDLITAGLYFLPTRVFDFAGEMRRDRLGAMRHFLARIVERGMRLGAVELGCVIDVDEPEELEAARRMLGQAQGGAKAAR